MDKTKKNFLITQNMTIREALLKIELNQQRSVIVVDEDNKKKVIGTLSDGDIRKGLINNILIDTKVSKIMNLDFIYVMKDEKIDYDKLLEEKNIFLLPIIDSDFNLYDIYVKRFR